MKTQRKPKNLGYNTIRGRDDIYTKIEYSSPVSKCYSKTHVGDSLLPVRNFYLSRDHIQASCIDCQKKYRMERIRVCREKFEGMSRDDICKNYLQEYGESKICSKCKSQKPPSEFPLSVTMETGLHNHCYDCCALGQSGSGIRRFIFMPDLDNIPYIKEEKCKKCGSTEKLAIDHILPISRGGTDRITNKQTLCSKCNLKKSNNLTCPITMENICERYRDNIVDLSDVPYVTKILSERVSMFRSEVRKDIRHYVKEYLIKYNLGSNLDRIVKRLTNFLR